MYNSSFGTLIPTLCDSFPFPILKYTDDLTYEILHRDIICFYSQHLIHSWGWSINDAKWTSEDLHHIWDLYDHCCSLIKSALYFWLIVDPSVNRVFRASLYRAPKIRFVISSLAEYFLKFSGIFSKTYDLQKSRGCCGQVINSEIVLELLSVIRVFLERNKYMDLATFILKVVSALPKIINTKLSIFVHIDGL